ncbi:MAG: nucleotidyl transferase AbiEii/AbiGii toxin family protein [bacterium]|nr:nucleotidyl transferase AbiEii/AbiGii toxin family protein [bacterium]
MGTGLLTPPTRRELRALAAATGFVADRIEKTVRLLALADDIAAHPFLGSRLALTGGTALNMFVLPAPRLSFDLDYHYIGAEDRATMKGERPAVEDALACLLPAHGLAVKRRPNPDRDHAGGKWDLRYRNAFGRSEGLSVDVGYVRRVPLWPTTRHDSHRLGRWQATDVPIFDIHEIAAGKLSALHDRGYARDLFDAALIPNLPGLLPAKLRVAFVVYGGGARPDWRTVCANPRNVQAPSLGRQLRPALTRSDAQRTRPAAADAYLAELEAKAAPARRMVLPFTPTEETFLDALLDWGRVEPHLLTADERLQHRIATEPWLQWKSHNTRRRLAAQPVGVHVRCYQADNWGWEVATTSPPRVLSGRHTTLEEAEAARDFLVRLVNVHPQLHIVGPDPQPTDHMPTVRVYSPAPNEPCYLLCLNADGTPDATSPPYPTPQAAYHTLQQLGLLSAATTDRDIGHRATTQTTSNTCRCSPNGWRCKHIELDTPEVEPPNRGHGLSL